MNVADLSDHTGRQAVIRPDHRTWCAGPGARCGPHAKRAAPNDPWGRPYIYRTPGQKGEFDLLSFGRDGKAGGSGEDADIAPGI